MLSVCAADFEFVHLVPSVCALFYVATLHSVGPRLTVSPIASRLTAPRSNHLLENGAEDPAYWSRADVSISTVKLAAF